MIWQLTGPYITLEPAHICCNNVMALGWYARLAVGLILFVRKTRQTTGLEGILLCGPYLWGWDCRSPAPSPHAWILSNSLQDAALSVSPSFLINCFSSLWRMCLGFLNLCIYISHADTQTNISPTDIICSVMSDPSVKLSPPVELKLQPKWSRRTKMSCFQGRPELVLTRIKEQHRRSLTQIPDVDTSTVCQNYLVIKEAMSAAGETGQWQKLTKKGWDD